MSKIKKILKNPRIIILLVFLVFALIMIHPNPYNSGATIRSIDRGSVALDTGFVSPATGKSPMSRERIISLNGNEIRDSNDYYTAISNLGVDEPVSITTNNGDYHFLTRAMGEKFANNTNGTSESDNFDPFALEDIGLNVYDAPKSNLIKGLDLQGGTRVLLKPERNLRKDELGSVIDILSQRLNAFGLSDIVVREAKDLDGSQFILVEIAGANEKEVKNLIAKQGKFEAKIANETVFRGGGDITYVCKNPKCARIRTCNPVGAEWVCGFSFAIDLNPGAAQRQADATQFLNVITNGSRKYLSEQLVLYLDDELVDELSISDGLKGRAVTKISISGSGRGTTRESALKDTEENMKELQTVLLTGALPIKLEIIKSDSLSPLMGERFARNSIKVGLLTMLAVALIVFARYRRIKIAIPMIISMLSEIIIILGFAALIKWNLDLVAIAGIIIAVGTGVDDLIVFTDEIKKGRNPTDTWKEKRKRAFFIIMAAYFTTVVAMLPLLIAGAGLLRGFAFTTILGVTVGVFIVRPAYAIALKILLGEN